jgi:hypothetical protein
LCMVIKCSTLDNDIIRDRSGSNRNEDNVIITEY